MVEVQKQESKKAGEILSPRSFTLEEILLAQPLNPLRKVTFTAMPRFPVITSIIKPTGAAGSEPQAFILDGYTQELYNRMQKVAAVKEIYLSLDKEIV